MRESFITTNGVKLRVVSQGPPHGPLVVLLHGFPEHAHSWRHQMPALAQAGFHVIAPDQRGYNLSDKPPHIADYTVDTLAADVAGLIASLGYTDAVIVGHDWGGGVAHRFAMDYPQRTKKLVIMNSPHPAAFARELRKPTQFLKSWYMFFFQIPWLPETLFTAAPYFWAKRFFRDAAVNKAAFSAYDLLLMAQANAQPGAMRAMLNWYRAALRDALKQKQSLKPISAPTLVIWAEEDVALSKSLTYDIKSWFETELRLVYIPHCGHWVQNEAKGQVNQFLLEFLSKP